MKPRVYIAARTSDRDRARVIANALEAAGCDVLSTWYVGDQVLSTDVLEPALWGPEAVRDAEQVAACQVLVQLLPDGHHRYTHGGNHCEFGQALALGKRLVLVGRVLEHVFHRHPRVSHHYPTDEDFLEEVRRVPVGQPPSPMCRL